MKKSSIDDCYLIHNAVLPEMLITERHATIQPTFQYRTYITNWNTNLAVANPQKGSEGIFISTHDKLCLSTKHNQESVIISGSLIFLFLTIVFVAYVRPLIVSKYVLMNIETHESATHHSINELKSSFQQLKGIV